MKIYEKSFLIILFFFALSIRIISANAEILKLWDETVYANLAWDLKANPLDYSFNFWGDRNIETCLRCAGFRAPVLPYSLAIIYAIFGNAQFLVNSFIPVV